jgi:hypothetical protein
MRIKSSLAFAAAILAASFTPCAAYAAPKACDLFTAQIATSILGTPVKSLVQMDEMCGFQSTSENENAILSVSSAAGAKPGTLNALVSKGDTSEVIAGLGESNIFITKGHDMCTLTVIYHGQVVSIAETKRPIPAMKTTMIQVMRQVLTKF